MISYLVITEKVLVAWDRNPVVEMIDLNDETFRCNLPEFPIKRHWIVSAGVVEGNVTMICAWKHGCYALRPKVWEKATNLKINRSHAGKGNVVLDGKLYISGGTTRNPKYQKF